MTGVKTHTNNAAQQWAQSGAIEMGERLGLEVATITGTKHNNRAFGTSMWGNLFCGLCEINLLAFKLTLYELLQHGDM